MIIKKEKIVAAKITEEEHRQLEEIESRIAGANKSSLLREAVKLIIKKYGKR